LKKRPSLLFVLPNLFTVSSIFCGLYAILQATGSGAPDRFFRAGVAILFAVLFDSADGRVARMTKTQSEFGVQFDSLADAISFGLAPAVVVYEWSLFHFDLLGMLVAFAYAACGAMRLARFNVMAKHENKTPQYFTGLPIPLAAASLISLVLLQFKMGGGAPLGRQPLIILVVLLLAFLMISRVRYRTFKAVKARRLAMSTIMVLAVLFLIAAWKTSFALAFMVVCTGFIALGPAEELVRILRRLRRLSEIEEAEPEEEVEEEEEEEEEIV